MSLRSPRGLLNLRLQEVPELPQQRHPLSAVRPGREGEAVDQTCSESSERTESCSDVFAWTVFRPLAPTVKTTFHIQAFFRALLWESGIRQLKRLAVLEATPRSRSKKKTRSVSKRDSPSIGLRCRSHLRGNARQGSRGPCKGRVAGPPGERYATAV